jgi:long-chain acyl-CoA synthetase
VAPGQSGELWIRGPMIANGYWNNEQATKEGFTAGYWHSGDIGSIDEQGYVRILDRKKDMINRGGYKVFSAEVENELSRHPQVVESVVVPSPDPVLGERVHAFICARSPKLTGEDVRTFCAPLMADYKIPEIFTIGTEPLPRNANGKFEKAVLRERARAMALESPFRKVNKQTN